MLHSLANESEAGSGGELRNGDVRNGGAGSYGGQFICTTFRPEMVQVAEKCYGVRYVGKSSSVVVVGRGEAVEFVQGERV